MNSFCRDFKIKYPIIQGGMVWCSGWKLASAVAKAGGLGVIGSGSMYPDILEEHLTKMNATDIHHYAVNLPIFYPQIPDHLNLIRKYKVKVVITSAGNPATYTEQLHEMGCKVLHVVANSKFALKAIEAGVDGIIAEGFEAGGHNGKDELTTFTLIPQLRPLVKNIPLIAAGGIASGQAIYAALALGAEGVQIGTLFAASEESSAHSLFKAAIIKAGDSDTLLTLKEITPVRLLKTPFFRQVMEAYQRGATAEELRVLLGKGRAKKAIFEGNWEEGEFEMGQVSGQIQSIETVATHFKKLLFEFEATKKRMESSSFL